MKKLENTKVKIVARNRFKVWGPFRGGPGARSANGKKARSAERQRKKGPERGAPMENLSDWWSAGALIRFLTF